jgi:hypothetical protein
MIILLKLIHFSALLMGGAALIGNGLIARQLAANPGPPPPMVRSLMGALGLSGLFAIILLWLSGLGMAFQLHGTLALGAWFYAKLLGATAVLVASITLRMTVVAAQRTGTPPDPGRMKVLTMLARGGLALALVGAVVVFN